MSGLLESVLTASPALVYVVVTALVFAEDAVFVMAPAGIGMVAGTALLNRWGDRLDKHFLTIIGLFTVAVCLGLSGGVAAFVDSVTGLQPGQKYVLALAEQEDGSGPLQPLAAFMTNPAGSARRRRRRRPRQGPGSPPRLHRPAPTGLPERTRRDPDQ